jgi:hypothetical protein
MILTIAVLSFFALSTLFDIVSVLRSFWANRRSIPRSIFAIKPIIWIGLSLSLILVWLSLSGIGGIGHQNGDYNLQNPIFKALIQQNWPLKFYVQGTLIHVVYYVGYYLPAAFIGKLFGWLPANRFLFLWAGVGVYLSFYWFFHLSRVNAGSNIKKIFGLAILFCLASGMDYVGYYIWAKHLYSATEHIENWTNLFVYSSNTSLLYWVPQQVLAGWLLTGLIADAVLNERNNKYLGIAVASAVLWSPFAVLGTIPLLIIILVKYSLPRFRRLLFSRGSIFCNVLAVWIGVVHLSFILSNRFSFPIGFFLQLNENRKSLLKNLLAFYGLEFAILGFLILLLLLLGYIDTSRRIAIASTTFPKRIRLTLERCFQITPVQFALFLAVFAILWVIPLFHAGLFNDFVMRTSIPVLFIFWSFVSKILLDAGLRIRAKFTPLYAMILMVVLIGFATSYSEIVRAAVQFNTEPDAWSWVKDINAAEENDILLQLAGNENSFFFQVMGKSSREQ